MKTSALFLLLVIWVIQIPCVWSQEHDQEPEVFDDWRLTKEKEGIRIYTRWVEANEGRKARQLHAVMNVDASLSAAVYSVIDADEVKEWLNRVNKYYHFEETDPFHWYAYSEFKIPWPLDNQDLVTKNYLSQDRNSRKVLITLSGEPDKLPEKENIQRISNFEGSWEMTPQPSGTIRIDYFIFTRSKPILPRWIVDPIITYGLWSTFDEMRSAILANDSRNIHLDFIL